MPEIDQYLLNNKELLELIIKQSDFHEGSWMLVAKFAIAAGNYGPSMEEMAPGISAGINRIAIQRAVANTPKEVTLDAAIVNPPPKKLKPAAPKKSKSTASRRRRKD